MYYSKAVMDLVLDSIEGLWSSMYLYAQIPENREIECRTKEMLKVCNEICPLDYADISDIVCISIEDAEAIYNNDPAAESTEEVMLCYPGFRAIFYYRIAHLFYEKGSKLIARYISEKAHSITGIDIHPGARIGKRFAIDHGTGIVIGETTKIGNDVVIYQGVTLGAKHLKERDQVGTIRHPTIEDKVVIYANATILGGNTVIGENSIIGGNTFITHSVEKNSKIVYEQNK